MKTPLCLAAILSAMCLVGCGGGGDDRPSLTLSAGPIVSEGKTLSIQATLSRPIDKDVSFALKITGEATAEDYELNLNGTIPAGQTIKNITFQAKRDEIAEESEQIIIEIESVENAKKTDEQIVITITDVPLPIVSLSITPLEISEKNGESIVKAKLSDSFDQAVIVNLEFSGTGQKGVDYDCDEQIVIPAGTTEKTVKLAAIDNSDFAPNETVILEIDSVENAVVDSSADMVTLTIVNDDARQITIKAILPTSDDAAKVFACAEAVTYKSDWNTPFDTQSLEIDTANKWATGDITTIEGSMVYAKAFYYDASGDALYSCGVFYATSQIAGPVSINMTASIFTGRTDASRSIAYSPNGVLYAKEVAPIGYGVIGIYRVADDRLVTEFDCLPNTTNDLKFMSWSPDNRHLAVMYHGGTRPGANIWDTQTGAIVKHLNDGVKNGFIHRMVFSRDNRWVYCGYYDGVAIVEVDPTGF